MNALASRLHLLLVVLIGLSSSFGQTVEVTARFDTNRIPLLGTTTFRVYAQVLPVFRANSDRIFSWYVNLLNQDSSVASPDFQAITMSSSDNDPNSSSIGVEDGGMLFGIYDTFLDLPGAGVAEPVELLAVPVTGVNSGVVRLQVAKGTGVEGLTADFIVAPKGGGDFMAGGDYSLAVDELEVLPPCETTLGLRLADAQNLELNFNVCEGFNHTVEVRSTLGGAETWQPLPNSPHNSGALTLPIPEGNQYFRLRRDLIVP